MWNIFLLIHCCLPCSTFESPKVNLNKGFPTVTQTLKILLTSVELNRNDFIRWIFLSVYLACVTQVDRESVYFFVVVQHCHLLCISIYDYFIMCCFLLPGPLQRPEAGDLRRCRQKNLWRLPWQSGLLWDRRSDFCRLGSGSAQVWRLLHGPHFNSRRWAISKSNWKKGDESNKIFFFPMPNYIFVMFLEKCAR